MRMSIDVMRMVQELRVENAKMRLILQQRVNEDMHDNCGDCWGGLCEECDCWISENEDELRSLGIEVGP